MIRETLNADGGTECRTKRRVTLTSPWTPSCNRRSEPSSHTLLSCALPIACIPLVRLASYSEVSLSPTIRPVYYDRVLLMDAGRVAEFDTPLNLFDKEDSIFRSLCDEAKLQRADIIRIRSENERPS